MWNPYHMAIVDMAATQQRAAVAGPAPRPPVEPAQPQQVGRGEPQQQAARKPPHGPQGRRDRRGGARRPLGKQVPYKPPPQLVAAMGAVHGEVRRTGELRRQQLQQQLEAEQLEAMVAAQQQQQQHAKKEMTSPLCVLTDTNCFTRYSARADGCRNLMTDSPNRKCVRHKSRRR